MKTTEPYRPHCGGCAASWTALGAAHCAACHRTFSAGSTFGEHRAGRRVDKKTVVGTGTCTDPAELGMVLNDRGSWGMPAPDAPVWGADSHINRSGGSAEPALSGVVVPGVAS